MMSNETCLSLHSEAWLLNTSKVSKRYQLFHTVSCWMMGISDTSFVPMINGHSGAHQYFMVIQ